jgi:hypothetical protein
VKQTKAVIKKAKAKLQTCAERPTTPVTAPPLAATTPDTPVNEGDPAISDAWKVFACVFFEEPELTSCCLI